MSLEKKQKKAEKLGIDLSKIEGEITEAIIDKMIDDKTQQEQQKKAEEKIRLDAIKKAENHAKKNTLVLKDVDGDDVEQSDYFFPRFAEEKLMDGKVLPVSNETAPAYFNKICGMPVDREELVDVFNQFFPKSKGFLFYKQTGTEVYLVIVPLKYAKTISKSNESRPGDFQKHAISFITEGSVNLDSLKLKLARIAKHTSISTEPLA